MTSGIQTDRATCTKPRILLGGLITACLGVSLYFWFSRTSPPVDLRDMAISFPSDVAIDTVTEQRIIAFCCACHATPQAASFQRDAWHTEVMRGYHFYAKSGRSDLDPPPPYQAIAYFRSKAAETVVLPEQTDSSHVSRIRFRADRTTLDPKASTLPPAVAHLKWLPNPAGQSGVLIQSDMRSGTLSELDLQTKQILRATRGELGHPCHAEPCDLNGDGYPDLVVADLGSFLPDDHDRGRVLWLKGEANGSWTVETLLEKVGRVADVRPVDLDNDGDIDLVVAEFGWHSTGGIQVLRNQTRTPTAINPTTPPPPGKAATTDVEPQFRAERLDSRPGTIHVPCADFDGDGLIDIVALVSQEHERVELYLNRADQPWKVQTLWTAPDPAFGMSGLELVDFDRDGDLDILFTNGDTFDSMTLKPSHGVQWLRNDGGLRFVYQRIADLSGVYRATAADFDADGDLDVIASVWMPGSAEGAPVESPDRAALVLFDNQGAGAFERHTLQMGQACMATIEVADFDRDGDLDFAVNSHITRFDQSTDGLVVWWNETQSAAGKQE